MTFWQRFREWRRSRPFWGGLLTVLSGLIIMGSMHLELADGTITIGNKGFTSYLICFVLIISGLLAWFTPLQRHFYGLIAVFVAVYSLLEVNLGGFFIGMLLGVAGGGLIFAWNPAVPAAPAQPDDEAGEDGVPGEEKPNEETETDVVPGLHLRDGVPAQRRPEEEEEPAPKASSPRHAALMIMVVALSLSTLAVTGAQALAGAAAEPCDPPAAKATASPSPTKTSSGGIIGEIFDFFGRLIPGGSTASPTPSASPKPSPAPTPCPTPSGTAPGTPGQPGNPGTPGSPGATTPGKPPAPKVQAELCPVRPDHVAKRPGQMTGSKVTMEGLDFQNVCLMPKADGSTVEVLHFTMNKAVTEDFRLVTLDAAQGQPDVDIKANPLTVQRKEGQEAQVHFFASRFRGNMFGLLPVDYSPTSLPPSIPIPIPVIFTNPRVDLVWVLSPALPADDMQIRGV